MADVRDKVGEVVSRAKRRVGVETPDAADADGRVGIVRGALRSFGSGNIDEFLDVLDDDVVWEAPTGKRFPGSGQRSGKDAVREAFVDSIKRTYSDFGFRPESFLDVDDEDAVVTIGRFEAEGAEGGNVDVAGAQLWEFKGNTVKRVCIFVDSAPFLEVVSEQDYKEAKKQEREAESGSDDDSESRSDSDDSEARSDDDSEGRSDSDDSEARSDGDAQGRSDSDDSEARSDGDAEARSGDGASEDSTAKSGERSS
jgi:ketosteroid isomerase-like protein